MIKEDIKDTFRFFAELAIMAGVIATVFYLLDGPKPKSKQTDPQREEA